MTVDKDFAESAVGYLTQFCCSAVFVTFYFERNQIELFQELKLLNKTIARN